MSVSDNDSFSSAVPGADASALQPSMEDEAGGPAPRKRVSQACVPCARRKTKCDGALPTCGQCRQRDIHECVYTTSRRNKRARRTSPYTFQRPSQGYEEQSILYPSTETNRDQEQQFQHQDGNLQSFATIDPSLSTSRAPPIPIPQRPLMNNPLGIPRHVSIRLLKDYFATIHPMWPILYKPMYDMTGCDYLPDSMPLPLLYSMYSIAACVQPSPEAQDDRYNETPLPAHLFESALMALQRSVNGQGSIHPLHLLKPSVENCQALTILALQQHGVAESASAALLCSLAASMAIELRLHRAMPPQSDPTEVQIRSRLWWNIFVLDKMMACEMKRPVLLRSEETDTPWPSSSESDEFQLLSLRSAGQSRITSVKTHTVSGFHTTIEITMIMERVSREIYSIAGRTAIRNGADAAEDTRMRLWQDLKDYYAMLDSSPLRLDMSNGAVPAPVTITNMVWMWCSTILLHRPFATHRDSQTDKKPKHSLHPFDICFVASNNICDILEGYADNLPKLSCDMIFPIFTTASTLSHYSKQIGREDPLTQRRIDMCVKWLLILGKSWKNAGARQEMLVKDLRPPQEAARAASIPHRKSASPLNHMLNHSDHHTPALSSSTPIPPFPMEVPAQDAAQTTGDDWAFLNNFGDAADEFYTMDTTFRELLQGQFDHGAHGQGTE